MRRASEKRAAFAQAIRGESADCIFVQCGVNRKREGAATGLTRAAQFRAAGGGPFLMRRASEERAAFALALAIRGESADCILGCSAE